MQYVGQTVQKLHRRLRVHFSKFSGCARLKTAISSYGKENFDIEEIEVISADSKAQLILALNDREKHYIKLLNTTFPSGYNLTFGGDKPIRTVEAINNMAKGHFRPVFCIETGQRWNSVKECAAYFNVKPKQISRVLKGQRKRLKWAYTIVYEIQQSYR